MPGLGGGKASRSSASGNSSNVSSGGPVVAQVGREGYLNLGAAQGLSTQREWTNPWMQDDGGGDDDDDDDVPY